MRMRRVLKWIGIVVAVLAVGVFGLWYSVFGGNSAIVDGQKIVPGVETVKDGFVSVQILDVGDGKVALVDAGNDKTGAAVKAALAKRGLSPASVIAILLTHGHPDHTNGCRAFSGEQVYALAEETALIGEACNVTHPLKDGESFDVGTLHVETFATPGHTAGSAVYLTKGVLFFGDSAGASSSGELTKSVYLFSKNPTQNVASLKALDTRLQPRAAEIQYLSFAHTGPLQTLKPLDTFAAGH